MITYIHHELRQAVDTRGGAGALLLSSILAAVCVVITAASQGGSAGLAVRSCVDALILILPLGIALIVILSTTGEWAHHTGRISLPLVRGRGAFYAAKCVAMFLLSLALYVIAFCCVCALAVAWSFYVQRPLQWQGVWSQFFMGSYVALLATFFGFGLASILRSLFLSIVAAFLVTFVWNIAAGVYLGAASDYLSSLTPLALFDDGSSKPPLLSFVSSFCLWYVAPVLGGLYRYCRSDV